MLGSEKVYDYDGDIGYFQRQLERAGINQEEFNMYNFVGLTADELQGIVNFVIRSKQTINLKEEE